MYSSNVALPKLLIEKGPIAEAKFMEKLSAERAKYRAVLQGTSNLRNS